MKIFIMAGIFPPDIGGPANYLPKLATALAKHGHIVQILCFSDVHSEPSDKIHPFAVHRVLRRQNIFIREIKTLIRGIKIARESDVIYANGNDFKALLVGLLTGKARVHKIVGDTAWERAQNKNWIRCSIDDYQKIPKSLTLQLLDWVRSFPLRMASQIITPSSYLKKIVSLWQVPENNIKIVYNAFQMLPSSPATNAAELSRLKGLKVMCTICRLVPWKGVDTLIKILATKKDLGLIIIGDGPLEPNLKNLAENLEVSDRVLFAGRQPRDKIQSYLSNCDFFILNSSYEGLPHVVLEAMSCEKLVLASAVGGTPEVVQDRKTGLLFPYNNLDAIGATIDDALSHSHSEIIQNAKNFIEKDFSFDRMIQETEDALERAATSR